jgi:hypothetical protein
MIYRCVNSIFRYCATGARERDERYPDGCGYQCGLDPDTCGKSIKPSKVLVPMGEKLTEFRRQKALAGKSARTPARSSQSKAGATPGRTAARAQRDTGQ